MIFNMTAVESKKLYEKLKAGIIEVKKPKLIID